MKHPPGTGRFDEGLARIEAFADGVMAIAITLLVLTMTSPPPDVSGDAFVRRLLAQWPTLLAYVFSFAVIGRFWVAHHHLFRYVRRYDATFLFLNLAFLLFLAVLPFPTDVVGEHPQEPGAVVLYATNVALVSLFSGFLWLYATRGHRLVDPALPPPEIRHITERAFSGAVVFGLSIPLGLISPYLAYLTWALVFPAVRVAVAVRHRRRREQPIA